MPVNPQDFLGDAQEIIRSRSGSPFNPDGSRTYQRYFRVLTNNVRLGPNQVCQAPGIPRPMSIYFTADGGDSDLNAVLIRYSADKEHGNDDEWKSWIVTCDYSTAVTEGGVPPLSGFGEEVDGFQNNPELERPVVRWDAETIHIARRQDLSDPPQFFRTPAGQPYTPAPTFEVARPVLAITRNLNMLSRLHVSEYSFAVNSDVFLAAPAGRVRCSPVVAEQIHRGMMFYWRVTYRLVFNHPVEADQNNIVLEDWQPQFLDAGTMRKQTVFGIPFEGKPVPIVTPSGPATQPILLDKLGQPLANPDTAMPGFTRYVVYQQRPFNAILAGTVGVIP